MIKMKVTYTRKGDYLLPDLYLEKKRKLWKTWKIWNIKITLYCTKQEGTL